MPASATELNVRLYPLRAEEPVTWRVEADGQHVRLTQPDIDIPHLDLRYLARFLPEGRRDPTQMSNAQMYSAAHRDLTEANRLYRASAGVWGAQMATLVLFIATGLSRSGEVFTGTLGSVTLGS